MDSPPLIYFNRKADDAARRQELGELKTAALRDIDAARVALANERAQFAARNAALEERAAALERAQAGMHEREQLLMTMASMPAASGGGGGSGSAGAPPSTKKRAGASQPGSADVSGVPMVTVQLPQSQVWLWRPGEFVLFTVTF